MYYIVYISLTYSKLKDTFGGGRYIPKWIESHTPMWVSKWSCVSTIHWINQLATENASKIARYFVKLPIVNIGALTQALLGFCICRKLWVEGISNDPNDLCRTTAHIITIVNIGGTNGYIS